MSTPLLENILAQPAALGAIAAYQFAEGATALRRAAELLRTKKRVVLSGMGASLFACQAFQYELARHGVDAAAIETAELLYFTPAVFDSDTAVVLVSRSGESVEVIKLLPMVREWGAAVIGIVNAPESTLAASADTAIVLGSPSDQLVAIQTYTGTVAVLALLGAAMAGGLEAARAELADTPGMLGQFVTSSVASRADWDDLLGTEAPLYILGRGPSLGTVAEGVLLMHETAKAPAVGMSVAQFRHGPVEVVDGTFRAVVLASHGQTLSLDQALVHDLIRMGGKARLLMPQGVPERFAPIAEIVPLQIAAYRKAELNGVRPGDFRWAPLVTMSETGFGLTA